MASYNGYDLGRLLRFFAEVLIGIAIIVVLIALVARRRHRGTVIVDVTLTLCGMWLIAIMAGTVVGIIQTFTQSDIYLSGVPLAVDVTQSSRCTGDSMVHAVRLACVHIPSGDAMLTGLSTGTRAALAGSRLLWGVLMALPALGLAVICWQLVRGRPFTRTVTRSLVGAAVTVLVVGVVWSLMDAVAKGLAVQETLPRPGGDTPVAAGAFMAVLPLWPFAAALGLLALAAVFRYGESLQHDTEGLV